MPKILVLDDDSNQLVGLRIQLRGLGDLIEFTSVEKALAFAIENPMDAAVVDQQLTGQTMTGLDFIREIRKCDPALKVILRTGSDLFELPKSGVQPCEYSHFVKGRMSTEDLRELTLEVIAATMEHRAKAVRTVVPAV
jgi:CheY-like chemotaxis protein